jgi:hypothetical protein
VKTRGKGREIKKQAEKGRGNKKMKQKTKKATNGE